MNSFGPSFRIRLLPAIPTINTCFCPQTQSFPYQYQHADHPQSPTFHSPFDTFPVSSQIFKSNGQRYYFHRIQHYQAFNNIDDHEITIVIWTAQISKTNLTIKAILKRSKLNHWILIFSQTSPILLTYIFHYPLVTEWQPQIWFVQFERVKIFPAVSNIEFWLLRYN